VWVDMESAQRTQPQCHGARELPFIAGHAPSDEEHCLFQEIKSLLGNGH
jgi:penicillin-binding protein 1B